MLLLGYRGLSMPISKRRKAPAYRKQKQRQKYIRKPYATAINPNISNTVVMPTIELAQTQTQINFTCNNKQQFRFVLITVMIMTAVIVWLMQNSVIAYYQQTYHKNNDLTKLENMPFWQKGSWLGTRLNDDISYLNDRIEQFNQNIIRDYNKKYAFTVDYLTQKKQREAAEEKKRKQAIEKASKENKIKSDFTLSNDDEVFFAGDSMMQGIAPHVQRWLSEKQGIKTINLSKQSTGLTYTRFFDWEQTISETLNNNNKIKILVVFLGPNDPWDMPNPKGGRFIPFKSPEWDSVYRSRIKNIIDNARGHHVTVLWLTPPNMRRDKLNEQMVYLRELMNDEVSKNHGYVIDTRNILGNNESEFQDIMMDSNGQKIKTRSADGIHFSLLGQKIIAKTIYERFNFATQTNTDGDTDEH